MPSASRRLSAVDVERFVRRRCFPTVQAGRVGAELEWLTVCSTDPLTTVDHEALRAVVARACPLPGGSRVTFEPGGQLELSSATCSDIGAACTAMEADLGAVNRAATTVGVDLVGLGADPHRSPRRLVDGPRYRAMEAFLRADGGDGVTMMCSTAALQVNLDIGDEGAHLSRWRRAQALGPVLIAAFANAPFSAGRPAGLRSRRAAIWSTIDRSRTGPVDLAGDDAVAAWVGYALAARTMLVRSSAAHFGPVLLPLPFGRWMDQGHELGFPTIDDFEYHLSTLFPPVRPRGWLELRMIDALPDPWWRAAVAVTTALLDHDGAAEAATRACIGTEGLWTTAARVGLSHPVLAMGAHACFVAALEALPALGADGATIAATEAFFERFVARGRCPADELLDGWRSSGRVFPEPLLEQAWS
ncbi:MAG: ergothioneine biosynthesis glutamate--cysteine ligase EgtA [Actinomycetota bacterium]|nr:ergothioneine biosynthesis glutamate--cysteine ligase EgtA [Actinomycetota bacterium]